MAEEKAGILKKEKRVFHPEKCSGCYLCMMACSLRYDGSVNPLKGRTAIIKKKDIVVDLMPKPECLHCGYCAQFCHYGAMELPPVEAKV